MSLKERIYSVLIVSSSESINSALTALLPMSDFSPVSVASSISSAKRMLEERSYDFVIVNSPLPDDVGTRFAIDVNLSVSTVVLLMLKAEIHDEVHAQVADHGVFTLAKPTSTKTVATAISWLCSAREKLRRNEKKTVSIESKMEEIRLVNRAKWLLISENGLDEPDAHRFIEKAAMDRCVSKKEIAEDIIAHRLRFERGAE